MEEYNDRTAVLNAIEIQSGFDRNRDANDNVSSVEFSDVGVHKWKVLKASVHCLVQTLIGGSVCVTLWYAFSSPPVSVLHLHIGLSVIGYQLLIAHGILSIHGSGWILLSLGHRRRVHWILQLTGSIMAIAGSAVIIRDKTEHFTSVHGKLALAALIFTCASLANGLTSLWVVKIRNFIPAKVSKLSHVVFGTSTFTLSSATLVLGFNKHHFKEWASEEFAYVMTAVVITYTCIVIAQPCYFVLKKAFSGT